MGAQFPQMMINDLVTELDPVLTDFFENTKQIYNFKVDSLTDLVSQILDGIEDYQNNLTLLYQYNLANNRSKRHSWAKKVNSNLDKYPISDPHNYFYEIIISLLRTSRIKDVYGTSDPAKLIEVFKSEIMEWQSGRSYFIQFPSFPHVGRISIAEIFKSDVRTNLYEVIMTKYNGNLNNWSMRQIYPGKDTPIFSAQKKKLEIEKSDNSLQAKMYSSDIYDIVFYNISTDFGMTHKTIATLDTKDLEILSYMMNNSTIDINSSSSRRYHMTISEIANFIHNTKHSSQKQRLDIEERIIRMQLPTIRKNKVTNEVLSLSFLTDVFIGNDNEAKGHPRFVEFSYSQSMYDLILEKRVLTLPAKDYGRYTTGAEKSLFSILVQERIAVTAQNRNLEQTYTMDYFFRNMLLTGPVSKNKSTVLSALKNISEKSYLIKSYSSTAKSITIVFTRLTTEEHEYYFSSETQYLFDKSDIGFDN